MCACRREAGGALRLLEPSPLDSPTAPPPSKIIAEVPPELDTLVAFWADEVRPRAWPARGGFPCHGAAESSLCLVL